MNLWAKRRRQKREGELYSTLLVTKEVYNFLEHHMDFLVQRGMIPRFAYNPANGRSFRSYGSLGGVPRVVHKHDRIQITVAPEFKTLVATICKRDKLNLYDAIYVAVIELSFFSDTNDAEGNAADSL